MVLLGGIRGESQGKHEQQRPAGVGALLQYCCTHGASPGPLTRMRSGRTRTTMDAACRPANSVVNTELRYDCPTCFRNERVIEYTCVHWGWRNLHWHEEKREEIEEKHKKKKSKRTTQP